MFNTENLVVLAGLAVFAALLTLLAALKRKTKLGFTARTAIALVLGIGLGIALQAVFGAETAAGAGAAIKKWINPTKTTRFSVLNMFFPPKFYEIVYHRLRR